jgi:DNA-binding FadR family transcriptional regulator
LYRQIAEQISTLIDRREFPAGSRLPAERELAVLLGVSRTSVREAIIALEIAGRVEVRVGTGIFVLGPATAPERERYAQSVGDNAPGPFDVLAARASARRRDRRARRAQRSQGRHRGAAGKDR